MADGLGAKVVVDCFYQQLMLSSFGKKRYSLTKKEIGEY